VNKQHILDEIKRTAAENNGKALGRIGFEAATGITPTAWRGKYWARWTDAILEAVLPPNVATQAVGAESIVLSLARIARHFGRLPTQAELRLMRQQDKTIPSDITITKYFPTKIHWTAAL